MEGAMKITTQQWIADLKIGDAVWVKSHYNENLYFITRRTDHRVFAKRDEMRDEEPFYLSGAIVKSFRRDRMIRIATQEEVDAEARRKETEKAQNRAAKSLADTREANRAALNALFGQNVRVDESNGAYEVHFYGLTMEQVKELAVQQEQPR